MPTELEPNELDEPTAADRLNAYLAESEPEYTELGDDYYSHYTAIRSLLIDGAFLMPNSYGRDEHGNEIPRSYEGGHWDIEDDMLGRVAREYSKDGANEERFKLIQVFAGLITQLDRESLTKLNLSLSLCPIHFLDYAICFDDDNPECSQVRFIHPNHDT